MYDYSGHVTRTPDSISGILERLLQLPFISAVNYAPAAAQSDEGYDGTVAIQTPTGPFQLNIQAKRSYLSIAAVSQLAGFLNQGLLGKGPDSLLLARHVPRLAALALVKAKINFADDAGNIHLALGGSYNWTVIGVPPLEPLSERRPVTPAELQLLFQFASWPESVNWPVRKLEPAVGISKSKAAQARRRMIADGLITQIGRKHRFGPAASLTSRLVFGYVQLLRPALMLGRFRAAEKTIDAFLDRVRQSANPDLRYSITGGWAAESLQHFYRGPDVTLFVAPSTPAVAKQLRLLPDREGPVTLLRAFGDLVFWEKRDGHMLAPPWLIYAELMSSTDSRAHEAAEELRREYLVLADS